MKIAFLRSDFWFNLKTGGSVSHIAGFAQGVKQNRHSLFFISSDKLINLKEKIHIIKPGILKHIRFFGLGDIIYNFIFVRKSLPILRREDPDFLYERYRLYGISGVILARKLKKPLVLEVNGPEVWVATHWGKLFFKKLANWFEQYAFQKADLITVVSKTLKKQLIDLKVPVEKIIVNPNGVNPDIFKPQVNRAAVIKKLNLKNKTTVGFIGTFGLWHGTDILAKTIPQVIAKNPKITFLLIGEGKLKPQIEAEIKAQKLESHVIFLGQIPHPEVPQYLAACDILVSPHVPNKDGSEFFGSPTKLFEYMAMEKGIVASRLGQIGEVLENNQTALLVEPENVNDLTQAILKLAANSDLRKKLGQNARQKVINNYTWEKYVKTILDAVPF